MARQRCSSCAKPPTGRPARVRSGSRSLRPASTSPTSWPASVSTRTRPGLPLVVGYEVAGTVDAVGRGVTRVREGDRVIALTRFGGYATSVVVPAAFAFAARAALSDAEAAALQCTI